MDGLAVSRSRPERCRISLRGKACRFRYVTRAELDSAIGEPDPTTEGLCIRDDAGRCDILVLRGQSQLKELDRVIHETLHACAWDLAEETVEETAEGIAALLWRLGWRRS